MLYAEYWIKQSVQRYLEKSGSIIRIPKHIRAKISRLRRITNQVKQEQGREPTTAEITALLGVPVSEVKELQNCMQGILSLDTPIAEDNSLTLADALQADFSLEDDTIEEIYKEHSKNELWDILERYTVKRENDVIREIFLHSKSMAQVAREQGLSFDAVRQIKAKGLRKLRIGRARRELIEKFDIAEAKLFRDSLNNYREHGFTSMVEHLVLKRLEAQERYQRHLAKIEEIHRNRLVRNSEKLDLPSDEGESEVRHYVESER